MELLSALDITLICLGAVCLLVGLAGCIAPMLPGPPISYVGLLLLHFTERYQFTVTQLVMWAVVVLIVLLLDYFTPLIGAKNSAAASMETGAVSSVRLSACSSCRSASLSARLPVPSSANSSPTAPSTKPSAPVSAHLSASS